MGKFFRNTKSAIVNIAQIMLIVFLIPAVFVICYMIDPNSNSTIFKFVADFVGQIPLIDISVGIIKDYLLFNSQNVGEITLLVILRAFPDAIFVSVVVHICNTFFIHMWRKTNLMNGDPAFFVKPMTVFPTFVGIVLCTIILNLLSKLGDRIAIISELIVIFIMILGFRLLFKSVFGGRRLFSIEKILLLIIDGIYAVILICFVATLAIVAFTVPRLPLVDIMKYISTSLVTAILATAIVWFVRGVTEKIR